MTDTISLNVNLDFFSLRTTAEKLNILADALENTTIDIAPSMMDKPVETDNDDTPPPAPDADTAFGVDAPTTIEHAAVESVTLDSAGLPWDVRINPSSRSLLKKTGRWKRKKNLTDEFVATIEAELFALMSVQAPTNPLDIIPDEIDDDDKILENVTHKINPDDLPPPPAEPEPTPPPALTFAVFMSKITAAVTAGTMTMDVVNSEINKLGVTSLPLLSARPDLLPTLNTKLFND